jgi:hypothetical protein
VYEYHVESKWCGWFGGWGSERDIAAVANAMSAQGWRLVSTKHLHALWWLLPLPIPFVRPKLLLVFERGAAAPAPEYGNAGRVLPVAATAPGADIPLGSRA